MISTRTCPVQSALTGESLPVTKRTGDQVFSGSTCKHGDIEAVVIATGVHSFLGKAAHLVDSTEVIGHFQQVILNILVSHEPTEIAPLTQIVTIVTSFFSFFFPAGPYIHWEFLYLFHSCGNDR